jgi:hypothetical protein
LQFGRLHIYELGIDIGPLRMDECNSLLHFGPTRVNQDQAGTRLGGCRRFSFPETRPREKQDTTKQAALMKERVNARVRSRDGRAMTNATRPRGKSVDTAG